MAATLLRRSTALLAVVVTALAVVFGAPASAAPNDPEGGTKQLRAALETAAKGYDQAKTKLAASKKRQLQLAEALKQAQAKAAGMTAQVNEIASRSYQMGRVSTAALLLNSHSPNSFVQRVQSLDMLAQIDGAILADYREQVDAIQRAKVGLEAEVREQEKQVKLMERKKKDAAKALAAAGGGGPAGGFVDANSPAARPAPRNSDGSWPKESCTVKDPTSGGCLTPRTLHAYNQARAAGFTYYTDCWSQRSSGEHPKGRACDFSSNKSTFKNSAATGSDKAYGDRLAAYLVKNADRLGVMYVIWYRQIWMPGNGWSRYSGSGGAAAEHTNHVHLSVL